MPDRKPPAPPAPGLLALPVTLIYAAFAAAWIVYSDQLFGIWFRDPQQLTEMQTWKGIGFVLATSLLLWALVRAGFSVQGRMREQLMQRERDWRTLFRDNPLPMWVAERPGGRVLAVNDAALRHYGYTRPEFMALTMAELARVDAAEVARLLAPCDARRCHYRRDGAAIAVELHVRDTEFAGAPAALVQVHIPLESVPEAACD